MQAGSSMSITIAPEQVERIVWNQHQDPFEVLGAHAIEQEGKTVWVVRAYLPSADSAWVVLPEERLEYQMYPVHNPHFLNARLIAWNSQIINCA